MPRNLRIPDVPQNDKGFDQFVQQLEALVAERCGEDADFTTCSAAARAVVAQALWVHEDRRLRQTATTTPRIEVDGEPYRRLSQHSFMVCMVRTRSRSRCIAAWESTMGPRSSHS